MAKGNDQNNPANAIPVYNVDFEPSSTAVINAGTATGHSPVACHGAGENFIFSNEGTLRATVHLSALNTETIAALGAVSADSVANVAAVAPGAIMGFYLPDAPDPAYAYGVTSAGTVLLTVMRGKFG